MRTLTAAESRVIHALLVAADVTERRREEWSGVPRATFLAARKRAFSQGWLTRRYVPDPAALGFDRVVIEVRQPFSDRYAEAVQAARGTSGTVVLWSSPETLLTVRFERADRPDTPPVSPVRQAFGVVVDDPRHGLPVYFDFEGAWAAWASRRTLVGYPAGLVRPSPDDRPRGALTGPGRHSLEEMLANGGTGTEDASEPLRLSDSYLPHRERALVRSGAVRRRVFPQLAELPPLPEGAALQTIVLAHGRFKEPGTRERLLPAVLREARARPFLLAHDANGAILGFLAPVPERLRGVGRPLLEVLSELLESISVLREPVTTFFPLIDHRYDRLVGENGAA